MQCPHCNQEHADNLRTCPNTNLPLGRMIACPNCGRESRPGSRFCAGCGQALPRQTAKLNPNSLNAFHVNGAASSSLAPAQSTSEPSPATPEKTEPDLPHQVATEPSDTSSQPKTPEAAPSPTIHAAEPIRKEETAGSPPVSALPEPIRRPAATPAPVTIDGAAAAWVAIPTSPRPEEIQASEPSRPSRWRYLGIGALLLVILAGMFFALRRSTQSVSAVTPSAVAVLSSPVATTAVPVAEPPATATQAATPTRAQPTLAPTDTSQPVTSTPAVSMVVTPTLTAAAGEKNRLLFISNRDNDFRAFLMDPVQPNEWTPIPLPEAYELINQPVFCGERIAYEAEDRSLNLPRWVFLYDPTSQEIQPISFADRPTDRAYSPGCSLDGRYMAVTVMHNGRWFLNVIEVESGSILFEKPAGGYPQLGFATWPAEDDQFLWMGIKGSGYFDINQTSNLNAGSTARTVLMAEGKYPAISPDGTRLVYFCGNLSYLCMVEWPSKNTLFQIPISYFKPINGKPGPASAAWSIDGAWVYFSSSVTGNWDIYRMRPDGSQVQNLTEGSPADELMPAAR